MRFVVPRVSQKEASYRLLDKLLQSTGRRRLAALQTTPAILPIPQRRIRPTQSQTAARTTTHAQSITAPAAARVASLGSSRRRRHTRTTGPHRQNRHGRRRSLLVVQVQHALISAIRTLNGIRIGVSPHSNTPQFEPMFRAGTWHTRRIWRRTGNVSEAHQHSTRIISAHRYIAALLPRLDRSTGRAWYRRFFWPRNETRRTLHSAARERPASNVWSGQLTLRGGCRPK